MAKYLDSGDRVINSVRLRKGFPNIMNANVEAIVDRKISSNGYIDTEQQFFFPGTSFAVNSTYLVN